MKTWQEWYQRARLQREIADWGAHGQLDAEGIAQARARVAPAPTSRDWLHFWRDGGAWLAALLFSAAIVCFIAANWSYLSPAVRLGGVQVLLATVALTALPRRMPPLARTLLLFLACVLTGVLLALIGQTYQTGADPWTLFALWAVLMLPWAYAGAAPAITLLVLAVANVALGLATRGWGSSLLAMLAFASGNGLALAAWEAARQRWPDWDAGRHGARALAAVLLIGSTADAMGGFFSASVRWPWATFAIWLAVSAGILGYYRYVRRDLPVLALWALCAIVLGAVRFGTHLLDFDTFAGLLLVAILVLGAAALAAAWLRRLGQAGSA